MPWFNGVMPMGDCTRILYKLSEWQNLQGVQTTPRYTQRVPKCRVLGSFDNYWRSTQQPIPLEVLPLKHKKECWYEVFTKQPEQKKEKENKNKNENTNPNTDANSKTQKHNKKKQKKGRNSFGYQLFRLPYNNKSQTARINPVIMYKDEKRRKKKKKNTAETIELSLGLQQTRMATKTAHGVVVWTGGKRTNCQGKQSKIETRGAVQALES